MVDVAGRSRERTCEYRKKTLNSPCPLSSWSSWDGTPIDMRVAVEVRVPFGASRWLVLVAIVAESQAFSLSGGLTSAM